MLNVREIQEKDIRQLADYWFTADNEYLAGMGVDVTRMPAREQFCSMLASQIAVHYTDKKAYALIWETNGKAIGHSNLNPVVFGEEGSMHLHIWDSGNRKKGYGIDLIKMSLPFYFKNFNLKKIYCEPHALNTAPNKILEKAGFTFIKEYVTTPGAMTFEQPVKRWEITKDKILTS